MKQKYNKSIKEKVNDNFSYISEDKIREMLSCKSNDLGILDGDNIAEKKSRQNHKRKSLKNNEMVAIWIGQDKWINAVLDSSTVTRRRILKSALKMYTITNYIVYELKCNFNNRVYVGIAVTDNFFHGDMIILNHKKEDTLVGMDLKIYPYSEWEMKVICSIAKLEDAIKYKDFYLNQLLDKGTHVYNAEILNKKWPRYVTILMKNEHAKKIVNYCMTNKLSINKFMKLAIFKFFNKNI